MKSNTLLMILCPAALLVPSCTTLETSNTYVLPQGGTSRVGGAAVAGEFIPAGGGFKFALYATGNPRLHDHMTVHSTTFRWSSGVTDSVPAAYMGRPVLFRNSLSHRVTQATWHSPGELRSDYNRESGVTVVADVSVKTRRGMERGTVSLKFDRASVKNTNLPEAPRELVMEARRGNIPLGDLDIGANRGDWKPQ